MYDYMIKFADGSFKFYKTEKIFKRWANYYVRKDVHFEAFENRQWIGNN